MAEASAAAAGRGGEVNMADTARGKVLINLEECKGCGLCVESCPPRCLVLAPELSAYDVHPARYTPGNDMN
jgi:formate hydrogenlyase subunit 6/NADH:ubiquinone oxidoreductase subunit I